MRSEPTLTVLENFVHKYLIRWLLLLPLLLCNSGVAIAGLHDLKSSGQMPPANIFHNYCSICHGEKGDGKSKAAGALSPPPRNFTAFTVKDLPRERMIYSVTHGRPGTAMMPWTTQLSAAEIESVVEYIRATFMPIEGNTSAGRGRVLYMQACVVCHGERGKRDIWGNNMGPRPPDFTSVQVASMMDRERMISSVTNGRPKSAMKEFGSQFSKADIEAIVDYIREAFMPASGTSGISGIRSNAGRAAPGAPEKPSPKPSKSELKNLMDTLSGMFIPSANAGEMPGTTQKKTSAKPTNPVVADMSLPMPLGLKGDPKKGFDFFMKNCATCHGTLGDGNGPRAYFITPPPRNFLLETSRQKLNRPVLFEAISNGRLGTNMPAWNKVLSNQEIANVAEFVFQHFLHPSAAAAKNS